jgi:hypothetical protein
LVAAFCAAAAVHCVTTATLRGSTRASSSHLDRASPWDGPSRRRLLRKHIGCPPTLKFCQEEIARKKGALEAAALQVLAAREAQAEEEAKKAALEHAFAEVQWSAEAEARETTREAAEAAREAAFDAEIDREVRAMIMAWSCLMGPGSLKGVRVVVVGVVFISRAWRARTKLQAAAL